MVPHAGRWRGAASRGTTGGRAARTAAAVVVARFAAVRALHVNFHAVGVLHVLDKPPCGVHAHLARRADVVVGF